MQKNALDNKAIMKIVSVSLGFDLVQAALDFIPIVGWLMNMIVDVIAWVTFYMLFRRYDVKFNTFERFMYFNSGLILDLVPFINTFAWTLDVLMVIRSVKSEERNSGLARN